jgi:hypothetical protein
VPQLPALDSAGLGPNSARTPGAKNFLPMSPFSLTCESTASDCMYSHSHHRQNTGIL